MLILEVAVPRPLHESLDYLPPENGTLDNVVGRRIRVPLGKSKTVGVALGVKEGSNIPSQRLRQAEEWVDNEPLLDAELVKTLTWASQYYRYPIGEVLSSALPGVLRRGGKVQRGEVWWRLDEQLLGDATAVRRAPRQAELRERLLAAGGAARYADLVTECAAWQRAGRELERRGLLHRERRRTSNMHEQKPVSSAPPTLLDAQSQAVEQINAARGFQVFLLDGVTGSGKTEVYIRAAEQAIKNGRQVLFLMPEIGLAPQLLRRVKERLGDSVAVLHSDLPDVERAQAWLAARDADVAVVLGTRSAVFAPLPRAGLIIVDEEHDPALTQQDGFRYSARDLAVLRARYLGVPIVLGSATPSLESLNNVASGRYRQLALPQRTGSAKSPSIQVIDIRSRPLKGGLSAPLQQALGRHLEAGQQVMLFLNRRGYAPVLTCHACGWIAECQRCDARLTVHRRAGNMRCHHCGASRPLPSVCPGCGAGDLLPLGPGTERLEEALAELFPQYNLLRIDRDTTRRRGELEARLAAAHRGDAQLLIGTQMLAKGHHLPGLTLVAVVDVDQGLFGTDFRATERLAQLVVQVAGRAGRGDNPGEVLLQTRHPEHPLLQTLLESGYGAFAAEHLNERRAAGLPPFASLALLRAEAVDANAPYVFLEAAADWGASLTRRQQYGVELLGPVPAPMERREGRYRAQLMLRSESRSMLQAFLGDWAIRLASLSGARKVRWSLDVDPVDTV
ncbi:primosomal protein N' [Halorhodospira halochloris]|uniref:primosomal protein N' n=1 Tax=Halorhodospira halochloris TaxID=1052 RepID=UPI001EE88754|nr:primosomal protein N' [Halorhodospira halochloris]MCG5549067.1 primosomal protein N' [Halorhodospira halochloris]